MKSCKTLQNIENNKNYTDNRKLGKNFPGLKSQECLYCTLILNVLVLKSHKNQIIYIVHNKIIIYNNYI